MKRHQAILQSIEQITPTILRLRLIPTNNRPFFGFQPGQYAALSFPGYASLKPFRSFSIASSPRTPDYLEFGIRMLGKFTSSLIYLRPGDAATIQGPFGIFTAHDVQARPIIMLAGGIGVTPFMSMIRIAADLQSPNKITLLFSNRSAEETPYLSELLKLQKRNPRFRAYFIGNDAKSYGSGVNFIPGRASGDVIRQVIGDEVWGSVFFLCGPGAYMDAMRRDLRRLGVSTENIRSESFSVKPGVLFEPRSIWPKLVFAGWGATAVVLIGVIANQSRPAATVSIPVQESTPAATVNTSSRVNRTNLVPQPAPVVNTNPGQRPASATNPTPSQPIVRPAPAVTPTPAPTYRAPVRTAPAPRATMS